MSRGTSGKNAPAGGGLRTRIYLCMGPLLVLVTLLAGFCLYLVIFQPQTPSQPIPPPVVPVAVSGQAGEKIASFLAEARKRQEQFIEQPSAASQARFDEAGKNLLTQVQESESNAKKGNDPKVTQAAALLTQKVSRYISLFGDLALALESRGMDDNAGLRQKLTHAGQYLNPPACSAVDTKGIEEALAKVGKAQQNYFAAPTPENQRLLSQSASMLYKASAESTFEPDEKQILTNLVKDYISAFDRYQAVSLATNDQKLAATFSSFQVKQEQAMHKAYQDVQQLVRNKSTSLIDQALGGVRTLEGEYLASPGDDKAAKLSAGLVQYGKALEVSSIPPEQRIDAKKAIERYQAALAALIDQDKKVAAIRAEVDKAFNEIQPKAKEQKPKTKPAVPAKKLAVNTDRLPLLIGIGVAWLASVLLILVAGKMVTGGVTAPIRRITDIARTMSTEGRLDLTFPPERNEFRPLADALNGLIHQHLAKVNDQASAVAMVSEQTDTIARIIEEKAEHDQRVAEAVAGQEEMLASVRGSIAQLASDAGNLRQSVSSLADFGQNMEQQVTGCEQSMASMMELFKAMTLDINQIATTITNFTDMTEQTSVMALNAAIKSTRADSQNKEFNAVTEELDRLSKRASETAKEIRTLINNVTTEIAGGESKGDDSRQNLQQLVETVTNGLRQISDIDQSATILLNGTSDTERLSDELGTACRQAADLAGELAPFNTRLTEGLSLLGKAPETAPDIEQRHDEPELS